MGWDARRRLRAAAGFALVLFALVLYLKNYDVSRENRRLATEALKREREAAEDQTRLVGVINDLRLVIVDLQGQVRMLGGRPVDIPATVLETLGEQVADELPT
ncbi:MAG: hypothetical protein ACRDYV_15955, partial [Acidimicrobiia bacterium]